MAGAPKGNNNAGKNKIFDELVRKVLVQEDKRRAQEIVERAVSLAEDGDKEMIKFLIERMDGKLKDSVEMSGTDGSPLMEGITVQFVSAKKD